MKYSMHQYSNSYAYFRQLARSVFGQSVYACIHGHTLQVC